jgi:hypothetical protein
LAASGLASRRIAEARLAAGLGLRCLAGHAANLSDPRAVSDGERPCTFGLGREIRA